MKSGIYIIYNLIKGNFYIGSAINLNKRKNLHFSDLNLNKHTNIKLQNSYNKYGRNNFIFEAIETVQSEDLLAFEQLYLNIFFNTKECYNLLPTAGSQLGYKHSVSSKKKMSETRISRKIISPRIGLKHTTESKKIMSEKRKGIYIGKAHPMYGKKHSVKSKTQQSIAKQGECHPQAKLTKIEVMDIKFRLLQGQKAKFIWESYQQVSYSQIRAIKSGKTWKNI